MSPSPSALQPDDQAALAATCRRRFIASLEAAPCRPDPFPHLVLSRTLPARAVAGLCGLDIAPPPLDGVSGAREAHNQTRSYLDPQRISADPVCGALADAFQDPQTVGAVEARFNLDLEGCYLRIEYAQDLDGFWLASHTDLGVKRFTLLCYLAPTGRPELGTDLYDEERRWACRTPFAPGVALAFAPSDRSWHGFEPRPIGTARKSLIVNYVTKAWRSREQLAFPHQPVFGESASGVRS